MELLLGSHFTFLYDCVFFEILIISFFICLGFSLRVHSVYCQVYRDIVPYCHATRVVHIWDPILLIHLFVSIHMLAQRFSVLRSVYRSFSP